MYKTHFQRWGFRKNLKASEGKVFEAQAVAGEEINLPVAYGRRLGSKRLKSRALRSNKQSSVTVALSPLRPIDAPDRLHLADNSLRAVAAYVNSRCDHWKSGHYSQWKTETGNWQQKMDLAAWQISEGQDMASSFQILNNACDEYKTILLMQEPVLLWATYDAILQLLKVDPNLARPFIKLVTGYCSVCFGGSHPLTILWNSVSRMEVDDISSLARPLIDVQSNHFRDEALSNN
ncbi:hypothetical protein BKA67DRAFT_312720 [Truncatella angustata]|uniref:Clr5 domain-containing protein n=1 Tax=Truncatella angustata TaxID=152316 RepID=A0A9P8ZXQ3_9PEZI|nr:uncharacterized protein BKA67DRAFT_312720 [Truncatella angustata]KAH6653253.1 hypothetical protein BKA67DRAFT_312720 [Truncatella angustata]